MDMTYRSRPPARRALLPSDEVDYLRSLQGEALHVRVSALYRAGWSLSSISEAFDPPRPRTTVRSWVQRADRVQADAILVPMPSAPSPVRTAPIPLKRRPISPGVPPEVAQRLSELSVLAKRYRARTRPDSAHARANQELTELVNELYDRGVPLRAVATAMGVTYRAVVRRVST